MTDEPLSAEELNEARDVLGVLGRLEPPFICRVIAQARRCLELEAEIEPLRLKAADRDDWQDACQKVLAREANLEAEVARAKRECRNEPCGDALDALWLAIILRRKPDYGDWEYPAQAQRHIIQEVEQIEAERDRLAAECVALRDFASAFLRWSSEESPYPTRMQLESWASALVVQGNPAAEQGGDDG